MSAAVVPDSTNDGRNIVKGVLVKIGNISYGIFYAHVFVLRCVTWLLRKIRVHDVVSLSVKQLMQFSLTLIIAIPVIEIVQRVDKKRKICPWKEIKLWV